MCHKLGRIRTRRVLPVPQFSILDVLDTALQHLRLVRQCAHDAAFLGAVAVKVNIAKGGWLISWVDVVPGFGVSAFSRLAVGICPCTNATKGAFGVGFEELLDNGFGPGRKELIRYVRDLLVNCEKRQRMKDEIDIRGRVQIPSVFQARAGATSTLAKATNWKHRILKEYEILNGLVFAKAVVGISGKQKEKRKKADAVILYPSPPLSRLPPLSGRRDTSLSALADDSQGGRERGEATGCD